MTPYNVALDLDSRVMYVTGAMPWVLDPDFQPPMFHAGMDGFNENRTTFVRTALGSGLAVVRSVPISGDCDDNGYADLEDMAALANCASGPTNVQSPPECGCVDLDRDSDVDLFDYARFQQIFGTATPTHYGACCVPDGSCWQVSALACANALHGNFLGEASACDATCPELPAPVINEATFFDTPQINCPDAQVVSVGIVGANFVGWIDFTTRVKLVQAGLPDIEASNVQVAGETTITAGFEVAGIAPGFRRVIVTNPDGQQSNMSPESLEITACPVGACCNLPDSDCAVVPAFSCQSLNRTYSGDGSSCNTMSCPPFGEYANTDSSKLLYGINAGTGLQLADDMTLAGVGARELTHLDLAVFGNGGGDFDVTVTLYDGCPYDGGISIPGTTFIFKSIPDDGFVYSLVVDPVSPAVTIPGSVWMVADFSTEVALWVIANGAELGFTEDRFARATSGTCDDYFNDFYAGLWANLRCVEGTQPRSHEGTEGGAADARLAPRLSIRRLERPATPIVPIGSAED